VEYQLPGIKSGAGERSRPASPSPQDCAPSSPGNPNVSWWAEIRDAETARSAFQAAEYRTPGPLYSPHKSTLQARDAGDLISEDRSIRYRSALLCILSPKAGSGGTGPSLPVPDVLDDSVLARAGPLPGSGEKN